MSDLILSIIMLAGLMLLAGSLWMIFRRKDYKRGLLMLVAALVMFANVAVWLAPVKDVPRLNAPLEGTRAP